METPEEAIEHLEYAVTELGHKVVCLQGYAYRTVPDAAAVSPGAGFGSRVDYFGLDSEYDYDAVWAKCAELRGGARRSTPGHRCGPVGRSPTTPTTTSGRSPRPRRGLAKALFLGGVTRRFPTLRFRFLECGAGWACSLYADLVGHFEKRNLAAMEYVDPAKLDVAEMVRHFEASGRPLHQEASGQGSGVLRPVDGAPARPR